MYSVLNEGIFIMNHHFICLIVEVLTIFVSNYGLLLKGMYTGIFVHCIFPKTLITACMLLVYIVTMEAKNVVCSGLSENI